MKGKTDSAASTLQPESQKSTTQQMGDSLSGNQNENHVRIISCGFSQYDVYPILLAGVSSPEGEERRWPRRFVDQLSIFG
jgi:hypothetical protein